MSKKPEPYKYEAKVLRTSYKSLQDQLAYLLENGKKLYDDYGAYRNVKVSFRDTLLPPDEEFRVAMGVYDVAYLIKGDIKKQLLTGYKMARADHGRKLRELGITFEIQNPVLEQYMIDRKDLQLSERQGSIARTTKKDVAWILQEGIRNWESRTSLASKIQKLDATTFSRNRAELIAVQETGQAFGFWNHAMMTYAQEQGAVIEKKRSTVKDSRVRASHRANEWEGRVGFDHTFAGTWDQYAPSTQFRCRCTTLYKIK